MLDDDNKKADDTTDAADEAATEPEVAAEPEAEAKDETEEKPEEAAAAEEPAQDAAPAAESGTDQHGRTLYNVKCSNCGKDTQVPFKPSGDRPVYCRDCYMQKKNA